MIEVILPPGKGSLPHYHPEVEEVYYILQGEAEMEVDGQVEIVGPGDKEVCYRRSGLMYVVIADL